MKPAKKKKMTVGEMFERQNILNVLFRDGGLPADKKKVLFRARRLCIEKIKEYNEIRESTIEKHSTASVNGIPFNGLRDKEAMKAFEDEMTPLADEVVTIRFPNLTLDDVDLDHYTPEQLDELVFLGLVEDKE